MEEILYDLQFVKGANNSISMMSGIEKLLNILYPNDKPKGLRVAMHVMEALEVNMDDGLTSIMCDMCLCINDSNRSICVNCGEKL